MTVPLTLDEVRRRVLVDTRSRAKVREASARFARASWLSLGSWRDRDVDRFVSRVVPHVVGARRQVATLQSSYIPMVAGGKRAPVIDVTDLRGVPDVEVYRRPAVEMRTQLAKGAPFATAQKAALRRLESLVTTDLQMASVRQSRESMAEAGVRMFQRTLGEGNAHCALCVIASTQRYYIENLLPIHPGCGCGVAPYDGPDVWVINRTLLEATHEAVEARFGMSDRGGRVISDEESGRVDGYLNLIVQHEHGEIGPVLGWRGDKFTGPDDF